LLTAFPATIGGFGGVAGGQPCSFRHADILTRGFSRVPHGARVRFLAGPAGPADAM
jgi:hypothetical protein